MERHRPGLRWKAWGAESAPHPQRPLSSPAQIPSHICASHTVHTWTPRLWDIFVHTCAPRETTSHLLPDSKRHPDTLREHLPPAPSAHVHSHSILNTPSPKEPHVNACTQAYPETCTHSYSHPCIHNTPQSTHIYMLFHTCLIYRHTRIQPYPQDQV